MPWPRRRSIVAITAVAVLAVAVPSARVANQAPGEPPARTPGQTPAAPVAGSAWPTLTLAPPDVERTAPELARLRDRLLTAIRERRLDEVRALMAPTIRDQDADVPVQDVLDGFGPLERGTALGEEWQALEQGLRLGGFRRDDLYVVPYIERSAAAWRKGYERLFIAGADVAVRADPDPAAAVVARVSHAVVQEAILEPTRAGAAGAQCPHWTPIITPGRKLAWVCTSDTRAVSGLYYAFAHSGGAWKLTRLYALPD